jgi:hypothetical protein
MNTQLIKIAVILLVLGQPFISCQKTARDTRLATNPRQADVATISEVKQSAQQTLSASDIADLDWEHSTMDNTGNTSMIVVISKTDPKKKLLYLNGALKMYTWQAQVHYIPVMGGRQ